MPKFSAQPRAQRPTIEVGDQVFGSVTSPASLELPEGLDFESWERRGDKLVSAANSLAWAIGDWWIYGQRKYGERARFAAESRFAAQTLMNYASVAGRFDASRRREDLSFAHHETVASLPSAEQERLLDLAAAGGWSRATLRQEIRARRAPQVPLPEGKYRTITADPPWQVSAGPGFSGGASRPLEYPTMSVEEIKALPIADLAADDAHLYLWTINKYVPDAFEIVRSWGFEYSALLTWAKAPIGIGLGGAFGNSTEQIVFAHRGSLKYKQRHGGTCFNWKRGRHSDKPEAFYTEIVEKVSPGPYLELFARRSRPGWDVWGSDSTREEQIHGLKASA